MNKIVFFVYKLSCLLMVMASMSAWFLWNVHIGIIYVFSILIWLVTYITTKKKVELHFRTSFLFPVSLLFLVDVIKADYFIPIKTTLLCVVLIQLLSFSDEKRKEILEFCGVGMALILLISLVGFLLSWVVSLPSFGYLYYEDKYVYENYIFFLKLDSLTRGIRFTSIFLEPGHVGMICAFFIYAFKYQIKKWYVVVFIVSLLFTISLAGYLLLFVGYILYSLNQKGLNFIKWLFLGAAIVIPGYFIALDYNGGDNIVNLMIIERLEYDEDVGVVGNNRTDDATRSRFHNFINTSDVWFGYPPDQYERLRNSDAIHGAGYMIYMFSSGIYGVTLVFLFYFIMARKSNNKKYMLFMLLLYAICFVQRAYPLWVAWLLPFICSMEIDEKRNKIAQGNIQYSPIKA